MSYIDGFVIAVPTANKQKFIDHANNADSVFTDLGATRVIECWGEDVRDGEVTDFRGLFLVPCLSAIVAAVVLALFFKPPEKRTEEV